MANWQSDYIDVNGLQIHYTRTGGANPPLVLAHGFSDDGLCWTPVAEALAADYDVIMVDARGHGRSSDPEEGYGAAEQADDLAGVIMGLELQHPAVLGHSMGAATALALAGTYPDLPAAILLEDPPSWWVEGSLLDSPAANERRARMRSRIIELKRKTSEELIAGQRADAPTWPEAELGPWANAKLRFSFRALNRNNTTVVDWLATVRRITCPVLLITADPERGALVTAEGAAGFQALAPHAQVVHIPGAGHNIRREQFAAYIEAVRNFLAGVDAGGK